MARRQTVTPKRPEDVKITAVAWQLFEKAVDRALKSAQARPKPKKAGKFRTAKPRGKGSVR